MHARAPDLRRLRHAGRPTPGRRRRPGAPGAARAEAKRTDQPAPRPPPPAIAAVRAARTAGLAASAGAVAVGTTIALAYGVLALPPWAGPVTGGVLALTAAAAAGATAAGRLLLEVDAEGVHASLIPPYDAASHPGGRPDGRGLVVVRPTTDGRGNGAFVREEEEEEGGGGGGGNHASPPIPAGAWLGAYEGGLLDEAAFWARYGPSGVADYCMRIDRDWTVDGAERAADTSTFSPCHINHARGGRANVTRLTRRRARRVDLYAARQVRPGEELLLDYGALYWRGREGEEIV